ncbi:ceramidase domain-containing protein [Nereida sp. MMG025]|uniref:ceramidase domain-containing protein n=1 Tax=Nereida sp. MMG025 TaxID=2909981 RepID=UPI001F186BBC|nr:ceramidase domain-containing protein [Nereida sp. MMG025]MCF6443956.1 ceramidase [Nereida sp. MMG025]
MDLTQQIDAYCERMDFAFWGEPINAVTNLAFIIAAYVVQRRYARHGLPFVWPLIILLYAIGIGSFLFHTLATRWAAIADTTPIAFFILTYLLAVNLHFMRWPVWVAYVSTLGFFPFAAGVIVILRDVPFFATSSFYWTVPILLVLYAPFVWRSNARTAKGMLAGAALLSASITLRSLDDTLCQMVPVGTHFWWHILNGVMLGYMIHVYARHLLGNTAQQG